jgi:hypothetical protein
MTRLVSIASVFLFAVTGTACYRESSGRPLQWLRDGGVTSTWTGAGALRDVTVVARALGGDGTIVNSETYPRLDQGFKLDLPGGRYTIDVTDAADHVIATYPEVVVDGEVTIGAPTEVAAQ